MGLIKEIKELMSISEIAISWGVNSRTITRYVKKMFPDEVKKSEQTLLNDKEVALLKIELEKHNLLNTRDDKKAGFVSARTSKDTEDFFRENKKLLGYGSVSALVLDAFPKLYADTVGKIKTIFSREELLTILTSFNGRNVDPKMPGASIRLEPIKNHKFKNFDFGALTDKYIQLSYADRFIVELWANKFWNGVTVGNIRNATQDPEEYIR